LEFVFISLAQIIVSIVLIILILLQERSSGLSVIFGGESEFYAKRRGLERLIFITTIVLAIIFAGLSLVQLAF